MYHRDRTPAWFRDAKWLSGIVLVSTLAAAVLFVSLAQLTGRTAAVPMIERVLQLTLLPEGLDGRPVEVRPELAYDAGERLELLAGVKVYVDPDEVEGLTVEGAQGRIADALAAQAIDGGLQSVLERIDDRAFEAQLERVFAGPGSQLVRAELADALLPEGLADGSRLADWPLQAERNPGEPVQPIVGVFVYLPPEALPPLDAREIGVRVIDGLADTLLAEGLDGARAKVTNDALLERLSAAVEGPVRSSLHALLVTLLVGREEVLGARLEQARATLGGQAAPPPELYGVVASEELVGRTPQEGNRLVLRRLAERAYEGGGAALLTLVGDARQAARLASVDGLVDGLSHDAHRRYRRYGWGFGAASALLLLALIGFSRGWGRLLNPGLALASAAALGALASTRLASALREVGEIGPPLSLRVEGAFGYLLGLLAYVSASLPGEALEPFVRNHLLVLAVGAGLIVLSLLLRLLRLLRPRRRSLL